MHRLLAIFLLSGALVHAAEPQAPIRALLVTGGCCHDYARQKLILTRGISARANVHWTIAHQGGTATDSKIPLYEDANWSQGFDVVVHNECFSHVSDIEWVDNILKPHREGLPAVLIHCAMHCYRTGDDRWFEFVGMQSPGHGPHYPFSVEPYVSQRDHYILQGFDKPWEAPKGELYHSMKVWPSAIPLASAKRRSDSQPQVCVWTNQYRKGRVFGTTIGHYNETMADPQYLDMVARGLLWAVGRDKADSFTVANKESNAAIQKLIDIPLEDNAAQPAAGNCCGQGNAAYQRNTSASSEERGRNNFAKHAVDGNLGTRWCAANGSAPQWWQVDLGSEKELQAVRIHWEKTDSAYRYRLLGSADGKEWSVLADASNNKTVGQVRVHPFERAKLQHLRVEFLGSSTRSWASIWEVEVYEDELPPLPEGAAGESADRAGIEDVTAPDEFNVTLFGAPPEVNYPVCIAAAPTGEVFVGVDEQGSLGKRPGGGKILRCIDTDGDGQADRVNVFARVDHPRGLVYDAGKLWVLHPPTLSLFVDEDLDGVADRQDTLIEGISTDQVNKRGADHTTNGIRMGIDGWLYIAVGDFGFTTAKAKDGAVLSRRGGGIVRIRPDGSNMEIYAWGLRNIMDVCIDPLMNIFTRDNTNDGGGWNVRLSHVFQSGHYGYPSRYLNYVDEIMPTLRDYGGGSGCGGMFFQDRRWPAPFQDALYTCDWGRSEVYRHNLPANGATFDAHQELFVKIPRPTDIDVDGSGRMYISSWKNGSFDFKGPNVGFVAQLAPRGFVPKPFPHLGQADNHQLVDWLSSPSAVYRLHSQRELLRRANGEEGTDLIQRLTAHAKDAKQPLAGRVAAIYTLKQAAGAEANSVLATLVDDAKLREHALRAMTDRKDQLAGVPLARLIDALGDDNPRVVAQAIISLGRLGPQSTPEALAADQRLLALAAPVPWQEGQDAHAQPNPAAVIPHLAARALADRQATAVCLAAIGGEDQPAALRALRWQHSDAAVEGVIKLLATAREPEQRLILLSMLSRLYYQEGEFQSGWWGTRPDRTGPYFDRQTWSASPRIAQVLKTAVADSPPAVSTKLLAAMKRHQLKIDGLDLGAEPEATPESTKPIAMIPADPNNPAQIGNLGIPAARSAAESSDEGDIDRGRKLFASQSCVACHTVADGQTPKGPHLVDIGKRYKRPELMESILQPSAKIAQGFDTYAFQTSDGEVVTGFVVSESAETIIIRQSTGVMRELAQDDIERRVKQPLSMMPEGLVNNLTVEQLADLVAYLNSL